MEGLAGVLKKAFGMFRKKSVYPLRLLDSNDTRPLKFWGFLMLIGGGLLVKVGDIFLYALMQRLKARYANTF
jgi:hypothetical protein